jgi:hypothetical protein
LKYLKTPFNDFNQALEGVRQGHYWGVASIRRNFSQAVTNKFVFFVLLKFNLIFIQLYLNRLISFKTDSATLNASSIHLYLDMTSKLNRMNSLY